MNEIVLCRRPGGCCPTMKKLDETKYLITFDDGIEEIITREQIEMMYERL